MMCSPDLRSADHLCRRRSSHWVPQPCLPDGVRAISAAYVVKVDSSTGDVEDRQWIDASAPAATGITLAGGNVWLTGFTPGADVPITPAALMPSHLGPGFTAGAYLSAVSFAGGVNTGPQITCVLDAANLTHAGAIASFQLLSIFGQQLTGLVSPGGMGVPFAGVSIVFAGQLAQLLYTSPTQINVAVSPPVVTTGPLPPSIVMQVTTDGANLERQFPFTASNLNLFASLSSSGPCVDSLGYLPLAANADGSLNSCTNPAKFGTTISFFVEGVGGLDSPPTPGEELPDVAAFVGDCALAVTHTIAINDVFRVDVTPPPASLPARMVAALPPRPGCNSIIAFFLPYNGEPVGPHVVPVPSGGPIFNFSPGQPLPMIIWVTR